MNGLMHNDAFEKEHPMLNERAITILTGIAERRAMDPAGLLAVCDVESGGKLFAMVNGRQEPLIRFEGHYFYRLLGAAKRNQAIVQKLAHSRAGKIRNPLTQDGRWKLLKRASAIDRDCALQSTSWGIGQVMGVHWNWLCFASVDALVAEARSGLEGQAELMIRFIEKAGLREALENQQWRAFARGYNGPAYASNRYDTKLAMAFSAYAKMLGRSDPGIKKSLRHQPLMLRYGDRGALVADLQKSLRRVGFSLKADGDFGPATNAAVLAFQKANDLQGDGIVGPKTFTALERVLSSVHSEIG
jgi:hypothetical protein